MDTVTGIMAGVVLVGGGVALWFGGRNAVRKRAIRFSDRPDMSVDEFCSTYYKDSSIGKETISKVLGVISEAIEVPAGKLRPSDRFDAELAPVKGWEYDDCIAHVDSFVKDKRKKAGVSDVEQLHTVDDLIRYVARLEKQTTLH
jgi:hypothetical protein